MNGIILSHIMKNLFLDIKIKQYGGTCMIRFATIGTSVITQKFLKISDQCPEFLLEAVYSRDLNKAELFAQKYNVKKAYHVLDELVADEEIDAVYVASPNSMHFQQNMMLLKSGKHVLCEKSMGSNKTEVEKMFNTAKEHGVILLEAMRSIYDPGIKVIKKNLYKLGCIRKANLQYGRYSSRYDDFKRGEVQNIFSLDLSAGALMDIGVYCVHTMLELFDSPDCIYAVPVILNNGIDGAGTILAKYDQMIVELSYSKITNSCTPSQIQGENGVMLISDISSQRNIVIIYNNGTREEIEVERCDNNMVYELQYFIRAIKHELDVVRYQQISYKAIDIMDLARKQMGVVFPADQG